MKVIIIGRGNSCLKSTKEFVESHDLICVVNKFIFSGYEKYVGDKADIQFRNGTCEMYNEHEVNTLKLKKIIYTHDNNIYPKYAKHYKGVEVITPMPHIRSDIKKDGYKFDPTSGLIGLYHVLKDYKITKLSLVGFDFYEVGSKPYYFDFKDTDKNLKYLWKGKYKGDKINVASGHSTKDSINFLEDMIKRYNNVEFEIVTNSKEVGKLKQSNLIVR
jgi:hypothetical protein